MEVNDPGAAVVVDGILAALDEDIFKNDPSAFRRERVDRAGKRARCAAGGFTRRMKFFVDDVIEREIQHRDVRTFNPQRAGGEHGVRRTEKGKGIDELGIRPTRAFTYNHHKVPVLRERGVVAIKAWLHANRPQQSVVLRNPIERSLEGGKVSDAVLTDGNCRRSGGDCRSCRAGSFCGEPPGVRAGDGGNRGVVEVEQKPRIHVHVIVFVVGEAVGEREPDFIVINRDRHVVIARALHGAGKYSFFHRYF